MMELAANIRISREKKAVEIVEELLSNSVDLTYLESVAIYIERRHYQDIVTERVLLDLCGYVLCGNRMSDSNRIKQKYKIDRKKNKVYDVTERSNFCSNYCYNASAHMQNQISETPVWMRSTEEYGQCKQLIPLPPVQLDEGVHGKEVEWEIVKIQQEVAELELESQRNSSKAKSTDLSVKNPSPAPVNIVKRDLTSSGNLGSFENVKDRILTWKSIKMLMYLLGEETVRGMYMEQMHAVAHQQSALDADKSVEIEKTKDRPDNIETGEQPNENLRSEQQQQTAQGLASQEMVGSIEKDPKGDSVRDAASSAGEYAARVGRFLFGDASRAEPGGSEVVSRREQILVDQLNTHMARVLPPAVSYSIKLQEIVAAFVSTLNLSSTNIVFTTREWALVCVILVELLRGSGEVRLAEEERGRMVQGACDALPGSSPQGVRQVVADMLTLLPLQLVHTI